jgi:hypothetical protein
MRWTLPQIDALTTSPLPPSLCHRKNEQVDGTRFLPIVRPRGSWTVKESGAGNPDAIRVELNSCLGGGCVFDKGTVSAPAHPLPKTPGHLLTLYRGTFRWLAPVTRLIMSDRFRTWGMETSVGILAPQRMSSLALRVGVSAGPISQRRQLPRTIDTGRTQTNGSDVVTTQ